MHPYRSLYRQSPERNTIQLAFFHLQPCMEKLITEFVKYIQHQAFDKSASELIEVEEEMKVLEFHTDDTCIVREMPAVVVHLQNVSILSF